MGNGLGGRSRLRSSSLRHALTSREWSRLASMFLAIFALHAVGWLTLLLVVVPAHYSVGDKVLGMGVGMTAYALGMRHAFDADHIAAIDNTTRKLMNDGQRPLGVGFFFSLGHSTVVFGLAALLAFGVKAVVGPVQDDSSALHHYTALIGTGVSAIFLYVIAIANLVILLGIFRVFAQMRHGTYNDSALEDHLNNRGFLNRYLGRFTRSITRSWQAYPLGLLFGLGFDTASEVALLVVAGTSAAAGIPWYVILCLPVLFAAGMSLLDTIDGSFMNFAYGWALSEPVRKVYYNLTITAMSVAIALIVGSIEVLGLLAAQLRWTGGVWSWVGSVDLNVVGFVIVGVFVATWLVALAVWKYARIEEKWKPCPAE
ncbi:HoxN/HupN/NixA family nickel/cobalt transporter [Mycolicibacterium fluoranthenivorans]|uniref:Nickel/cobalt efflux system n=1 Tax=Mycolicibacterium fluoranthenivorans TaxID=258505 RepID=A0A7G8PHV1_9MYCO|nr:HoxN/HupN/NixA family nickel/cobalt transporter [Mycolicibacterium fluoranthenivorans]QNJ93917.1 HoxN/HupN/NixA family nickel/cobalt transporter [Mycolicibacterium fluoranthenivorans]